VSLKLILVVAIAFVAGLSGGTAAVVMRPHAQAAAADSAAVAARADSARTAAHAAAADSGHADAAPHAAAAPPHTATADAPAARDSSAPPPAAAAPVTATAASTGGGGYRQLARVLSNMKPADAAKIVAFLSDDQVEGLLGQLGVRQAASLLSAMPTERAAALGRRMLDSTPEVK
jgi:hypothetical protein